MTFSEPQPSPPFYTKADVTTTLDYLLRMFNKKGITGSSLISMLATDPVSGDNYWLLSKCWDASLQNGNHESLRDTTIKPVLISLLKCHAHTDDGITIIMSISALLTYLPCSGFYHNNHDKKLQQKLSHQSIFVIYNQIWAQVDNHHSGRSVLQTTVQKMWIVEQSGWRQYNCSEFVVVLSFLMYKIIFSFGISRSIAL